VIRKIMDEADARTGSTVRLFDAAAQRETRERLLAAPARTLLLDYDGTLRELEARPELATPTGEIVRLLRGLGELPATDVHIVSGRTREVLERWFGGYRVGLGAEHGLFCREPDGRWRRTVEVPASWLPGSVEAALDEATDALPGAMIERKEAAVAWHYREADARSARKAAAELEARLRVLVEGSDAELLHGSDVLELRPRGVDKGLYLRQLVVRDPTERALLAAGDDRTDADLFAALPISSIALHVGGRVGAGTPTSGKLSEFALPSPRALRAFLGTLIGYAGTAQA
jgi:trehalose 6-phosphate synthase/phosphatase